MPDMLSVNTLPASRELDALVAEQVMGKLVDQWAAVQSVFPFIPSYSTSIAAAWEVVEKLCSEREHGLSKYEFTLGHCLDGCWHAEFNEHASGHDADTAPLAICRAALRAVGC